MRSAAVFLGVEFCERADATMSSPNVSDEPEGRADIWRNEQDREGRSPIYDPLNNEAWSRQNIIDLK